MYHKHFSSPPPTDSIINNYQNLREEQRKDKEPNRQSAG